MLASISNRQTEQHVSSCSVPTSSTTYLSGYGAYGSFSGTATSYGTTSVPYTYTVTRYDHTVLFLKNMNVGKRAPWDYMKARLPPYTENSRFTGLWRNDDYTPDLGLRKNHIAGFIVEAGDTPKAELAKINPTMSWSPGDIKFLVDEAEGLGFYLMATKSPKPARITINKFGHLEVALSKTEKVSFQRVRPQN